MKLTEKYLRNLYAKMISQAEKSERKGNLDNANRYLTAASNLSYIFYLSYRDEKADYLLRKISQRITPIGNYKKSSNTFRCVFLDSSSVFNGGLTIQYMRAIETAGWDVLYLSSQNMDSVKERDLREIILSNPKAKIASIPHSLKGMNRLQYMYDTIVNFNPTNVFIHMSPFAPYFAEVCYALPKEITKYLIDYTDHSFLLGADCADYILEFRDKGAFTACRYRGVREDQIILLPYYPNLFVSEYKGLPEGCKGKKIVLSGGNYWKIMDENGTFFKMSKAILDANPEAVMVYAGMGQEEPVRELVNKFGIEDRFYFLGWRKDINELFERADLYLSTYPAIGGLMGIYAGIKSKPILALKSPNNGSSAETTICILDHYQISKESIEEVVDESVRILRNPDYAREVGERIHKCCVSREWFDEQFKKIVGTPHNYVHQVKQVDCEISKRSIENAIVYNEKSGIWKKGLSRYLGWLVIYIKPSLFIDAIYMKVKNAIKMIKNDIKK